MQSRKEDLQLLQSQHVQKEIIPAPGVPGRQAIIPVFQPHSSSYDENFLRYFEYVRHFTQYEELPITPVCELEYLFHGIGTLIKADFFLEGIQMNVTVAEKILLATQYNGNDDPYFYKKFLESLTCNSNYTLARGLAGVIIDCFTALLEGIQQVPNINPKDKRQQFIIATLNTYLQKKNDLDADKLTKIIEIYVASGIYKECRHIIAQNAGENFTKSYGFSDINVFKLSQALLAAKDYSLLETLCNVSPQKQAIVLYAINLLDEKPEELRALEQPDYQKADLNCAKLSSTSIEDVLTGIFSYMDTRIPDSRIPNDIAIYSFAQSVIKKYSFTAIINFLVHFIEDKTLGNSSNLLIRYLLLHAGHDFTLDFATIQNLLQLTSRFSLMIFQERYGRLEIDFFKLLKNLNETEQTSLLARFKTDAVKHDNQILLQDYPLRKSETPVSHGEANPGLPFGLYMAIFQTNDCVPQSFYQFIRRFQKAVTFSNMQQGDHNTLNYNDFMILNVFKLVNLYEFMGNDLFNFLGKMIATSVNAINRYLGSLSIIPKEYFQALQLLQERFKFEFSKHSGEYDTILIKIGQLEEILSEITPALCAKNQMDELKNALLKDFILAAETSTLEELSKLLSEKLITVYKILLKLPTDEAFDFSVLTGDAKLLSRLLTARKSMKNEMLSELFDKLIENDLKVGGGFYEFSKNTNQTNPLGKQLAHHNEKIEEELSKGGILTARAFNYEETAEFTTRSTGKTDFNALAGAVYADIQELTRVLGEQSPGSLSFFPEGRKSVCNQLLDSLNKVVKECDKNKKDPLHPLKNGALSGLLTKISFMLQTILKNPAPLKVQEQGQHLLEHHRMLDEAIKNNPKHTPEKKSIPEKNFIVKQWDKSRIETFLLGDYLGCCLAPDGSRFSAIVQRRIDAAMMMHVVFDRELDEPVCGNWLFFACDKARPNDIYVVANFFEIRAGYGLNAELRNELVAQLLSFTGKYSESVGAKGFIIRPLNYGLIPDFKDKYDTKEVGLTKVGSFFKPLSGFDHMVEERYFLEALNIDKFYVYKPANTYEEQTTFKP